MEACWVRIIVSLFFFLKTDMIIYTYNKISCWSRCNVPVYVFSYVLRYVRLLMSIYRKLGSRNSAMEHIFFIKLQALTTGTLPTDEFTRDAK